MPMPWSILRRGVTVAAVAVGAIVAIAQGTVGSSSSAYLSAGEAVSSGHLPTIAGVERLLGGADQEAGIAVTWCHRPTVFAAGQVRAAAVDAVIDAGRIDLVRPALDGLQRAARRLIDCSPGDGFGWAWLGYVADERGASDDEVRSLFSRSLWTAPSERGVVTLRLKTAAAIRSRRGAVLDDVLRADLRTVLSQTDEVHIAAQIVGPIYQWVEPLAQAEFSRLDDGPERSMLITQFGQWRANIASCDARRFNDWQYRGMRGSCEGDDRIPDFDWKRPTN